ncbi:MAG TPA: protein kinase [Candidatus Acidoferrales bacterium]|nr:protein kinase [Candidatus Acidoferrales bacterium]
MPSERWTLLETLFLEAMDIPTAGQTAFATAACGADTGLRNELLRLIRFDTPSEGDDVPDFEGALRAGAADLVEDDSLEGRTLGAYRIEREIGRGGMSVVYLAVRVDGEFSKRVAVKLIKRGMDTAAVMERLRRERRILASLEHPYIARLLDGGSTADGRPYIVMEYVVGAPIGAYCRERSLGVDERCALMEKVCEAVAYAHRGLVVHRDLKPANILVTPDGNPHLLDFGVARVLEGDPWGEEQQPETRGASRAFTPEYASPEQLSGASSGTPGDVYSLGVILYELLAEVRPKGPESEPVSVAARAAFPRRWSKRLEGDLDNIVRKALEPETDRRYHSVEQLQQDFYRHRCGLPVGARRDSVLYRSGKFFRRHRVSSLAAAAAVLAMAGGLGATLWQAHVAEGAREVAEVRRVDADRQRLRAEEEARQSAIARKRAESEHAEAELQKTAAQTERALAERRFAQVRELAGKFTGDVQNAIVSLPGSTPARKMIVETGLRYYDSLAAEARGDRGLLEEVARGYVRLGDAQGNPYNANLGDRQGAMASYRKAEALRARVSDDSPAFLTDRIVGSVKISQMLTTTGDFTGARNVLGDVLKMVEGSRAAGDYDVRSALARAWTAYGDLASRIGDHEKAIGPYEKVLAIWTGLARDARNPASERAGIALADTKLGEMYARMDRSKEALAHLRPALEADKAMVALQPNSMARVRKLFFDYIFMDWAFRAPGGELLGSAEETRGAVENAAQLADQMAAADANNTMVFLDVSVAQNNYGMWQRRNRNFAEALVHFQKSEEAVGRFTTGRPHTAEFDDAVVNTQLHMGSAWTDVGRPEEGLKYFAAASELVAAMEKQTPGTSRMAMHRAEIEEDRGLAYLKQQDWSKAIAAFVTAISATEGLVKADPSNKTVRNQLPHYRRELADAYVGAKQTSDARITMEALLADLHQLAGTRALSTEELQFRADAEAALAAPKR